MKTKTTKTKRTAKVIETMGNWMVRDNELKRMLCLCTKVEDARMIARLINRGDVYVA